MQVTEDGLKEGREHVRGPKKVTWAVPKYSLGELLMCESSVTKTKGSRS